MTTGSMWRPPTTNPGARTVSISASGHRVPRIRFTRLRWRPPRCPRPVSNRLLCVRSFESGWTACSTAPGRCHSRSSSDRREPARPRRSAISSPAPPSPSSGTAPTRSTATRRSSATTWPRRSSTRPVSPAEWDRLADLLVDIERRPRLPHLLVVDEFDAVIGTPTERALSMVLTDLAPVDPLRHAVAPPAITERGPVEAAPRRVRGRTRRSAVPLVGGRSVVPRALPPHAAPDRDRRAGTPNGWLGRRAAVVQPGDRGARGPGATRGAGPGRAGGPDPTGTSSPRTSSPGSPTTCSGSWSRPAPFPG